MDNIRFLNANILADNNDFSSVIKENDSFNALETFCTRTNIMYILKFEGIFTKKAYS